MAPPTSTIAAPIRRQLLADSVYDTLLESILTGRFPPGTELSAAALAIQLQVSRTPVTESLQRLAHDGLVEQVANHPPRVVNLSRADIAEIYDVRLLLEAAAAELAAERLDEAALSRLRSGAEAIAAARGEVDWTHRALEFDLEFHREIAAGCGNRRLRDDIERYRRLVRSFCRLTGSVANLESACQEHLEVVAALEARRPAAARKAMAAHIRRRKEAVLREVAGNTVVGTTVAGNSTNGQSS